MMSMNERYHANNNLKQLGLMKVINRKDIEIVHELGAKN